MKELLTEILNILKIIYKVNSDINVLLELSNLVRMFCENRVIMSAFVKNNLDGDYVKLLNNLDRKVDKELSEYGMES